MYLLIWPSNEVEVGITEDTKQYILVICQQIIGSMPWQNISRVNLQYSYNGQVYPIRDPGTLSNSAYILGGKSLNFSTRKYLHWKRIKALLISRPLHTVDNFPIQLSSAELLVISNSNPFPSIFPCVFVISLHFTCSLAPRFCHLQYHKYSFSFKT